MAFVFPTDPNIGDTVTNSSSGQIFRWNGFAWGGDSANALLTASFAFTASSLLGGIPTASQADTASYLLLEEVANSGNYGNDEAASVAGIPIGGLYRNGNFVQIRIS